MVGGNGDERAGQNKILSGQDEISVYCGRCWRVVIRWIKDLNFPAVKIDGRWESDKDLIVEWRKRQIGKKG